MTDYKEFLDDSYDYETDTLNAEKAKNSRTKNENFIYT